MAGTHARYSPSGAHGWMRCADWTSDPTGSKYANQGTAAHEIAAAALKHDKVAVEYKGLTLVIDGDDYLCDDEMVEAVQSYLDIVRAIPGERFVEQALPIAHITGEADAKGTADCVIFADDELIVVDLKYGRGVRVDAEENEQLQIYALAALDQFEMLADFSRVRMMIVQPRIDHVSEWVLTVEDLRAFGQRVKPADVVAPGEKQCMWCARKATCEALNAQVIATVEASEPVESLESSQLAGALARVDLIEDWCKAIRAEAERRLLEGKPVPGYKLVQGRMGARAWDDAAQVEELLKSMRLRQDEMYDLKLISPTTAEKKLKDQPKRWSKLQQHITQKPGAPSVAPASDKRPALSPAVCESEFQPVTA